jgi:hypothetical protein
VSPTEGPWSKQDDGDLKQLVRQGRTLREAAIILDRTIADVARRLTELGRMMAGAHVEKSELDE